MNIRNFTLIGILLCNLFSCKNYISQEITTYQYFDVNQSESLTQSNLIAISNEEHLQYGANVAYIDTNGDTIIPFGKYAYFGTDTLYYYANVIVHPNDSTWGRMIGIDLNQNILFDLVMFDNGPDYIREGYTRVLRNGKMGYANKYGQVIIPCQYEYARWFNNGQAEVTYKARMYKDLGDHLKVESKEWFLIDKNGKIIK
jgi:hypothetical protein